MTPEIENYPGIAKISGFEFAQGLYEQAKNLGMEYETGKVTALKRECNGDSAELEVAELSPDEEECSRDIFKVSVEQGGEQKLCRTRSVILATGARNRPLGLKNEREMIGHGVSYCATCDGRFFRGRKGGGWPEAAIRHWMIALFLAQYCEKVYLIHRQRYVPWRAGEAYTVRDKGECGDFAILHSDRNGDG